MNKGTYARIHAHAAELGAEVRSEDLNGQRSVADIERWRRKKDEPLRRSHANGVLSLRLYVYECGYDSSVMDTLLTAISAAGGVDHAVKRPDWLMGLYLKGGTEEEAVRIGPLPSHSNEKRTLAKSWTRAFGFLQAEQERVGIVSVRRKHGERRGGKNRTSTMHVLCAQDLAEIETAAGKIRAKRFERFALAAREHIKHIRRDATRFAMPTPKTAASPRPKKPEPTEAVTQNQQATDLVAEVCALAKERLLDVMEKGASAEQVNRLRNELHAKLEEVFAESAHVETPSSETIAVLSTSYIQKSGVQNRETGDAAAASNVAQFGTGNSENAQQNDTFDVPLVYKSVHQSDPETTSDSPARAVADFDAGCVQVNEQSAYFPADMPDFDPDEIQERIAVLTEDYKISPVEAEQIAWRELESGHAKNLRRAQQL